MKKRSGVANFNALREDNSGHRAETRSRCLTGFPESRNWKDMKSMKDMKGAEGILGLRALDSNCNGR
jgi:hypothetical protein